MPIKSSISLSLAIDGLGILASVAEAVPALGTPVKGSVEALKQILQYARVGHSSDHTITWKHVSSVIIGSQEQPGGYARISLACSSSNLHTFHGLEVAR
jgi:hypothetical protein